VQTGFILLLAITLWVCMRSSWRAFPRPSTAAKFQFIATSRTHVFPCKGFSLLPISGKILASYLLKMSSACVFSVSHPLWSSASIVPAAQLVDIGCFRSPLFVPSLPSRLLFNARIASWFWILLRADRVAPVVSHHRGACLESFPVAPCFLQLLECALLDCGALLRTVRRYSR